MIICRIDAIGGVGLKVTSVCQNSAPPPTVSITTISG